MNNTIITTIDKICLQEKGSIISGPFGSNISSKFFVSEGVPVIRGNNLSLSYDKFYDNGFVFVTKEKAKELKCYACRGDLIFTAAGTIGQVGVIPSDSKYELYVISNKQIRARIDTSKVDLLYAYYWFSSSWIQALLIKNNKGSSVPLLTLNEVRNLPITYPEDINEQRRIAYCIDIISRKIENNIKINDNLHAQLKMLYDYWFTQFDFPNDNGEPFKTSGGKLEWNEILKRNIPDNFSVISISQILSFLSGYSFSSDDFKSNAKYKLLTIKNVQDTGIIPEVDNFIDDIPMNMPEYCLLKPKDILMSLTGNVSRVGILYFSNCMLNQRVALVKANNSKIYAYVYMLLKSDYIRKKFETIAGGSSQANLSPIEAANTHIAYNDLLAEKFSNLAEPLINQIVANLQENLALTELRDWLLPMLMNGQATITN